MIVTEGQRVMHYAKKEWLEVISDNDYSFILIELANNNKFSNQFAEYLLIQKFIGPSWSLQPGFPLPTQPVPELARAEAEKFKAHIY